MSRTRTRRNARREGREFQEPTEAEGFLARFLLAQEPLRAAIEDGSVVQLRASGDEQQNALFANAATLEVNSGDAAAALKTVQGLRGDARLILVHNVLDIQKSVGCSTSTYRRLLAPIYEKGW